MGLGLFSFYILYAIQILHIRPAALGVAIALGGAGSLVGGVFTHRIARHLSIRASFFLSAVVIGIFQLLIPLASFSPRFALVCICLQQFFGDFAWTVYYVNETTLRQTVAPPQLLGRVNAAIQLASRGMLPIGALAGGYLGSNIGIANTLWVGCAGVLLSTLWLVPIMRRGEEKLGDG
jgi:predicted MFS family arabinose efflux permease